MQAVMTMGHKGAEEPLAVRIRIREVDLLPNPDEAVVVVAEGPKPNAVDAVVFAPNEPNENPGAPL